MTKKKTPTETPMDETKQVQQDLPFDPMALSKSLTQAYGQIQPIMQSWLQKQQDITMHHPGGMALDPMNATRAWVDFMQHLYSDPQKLTEMQAEYWRNWMTLWQDSARRMAGEDVAPHFAPDKGDRRFKNAAWQDSALFDFIKQSYLMSSRWMNDVVRKTEGLDPDTRRKVEFYTRQIVDAMAPSNFVLTNPDVLQATIESNGENLVKGFQNLLEDLERGRGKLQISTTDYDAFKIGENIATTPGKVVYQNDLIQLIQYEPTTKDVYKRPLLIIPPWINKFYILDLRPDNSFIRYLLDKGQTVFIISWANPDKRLAMKTFIDYMKDGILSALDAVEAATGEKDCNVIGYCLGGTLLTTALAWMKGRGKGEETRIASATFLTTLIDFEDAGDIKVFIDEEQLHAMENEMSERGFLAAQRLKDTFSLLRANDLIWGFVVNNYLLGREPFPFDLLYWNDDSTNMPAAMHSYYLRNMYIENRLVRPGAIKIDDIPIDAHKIDTPAYFLSAKEDHIAPWMATFSGARILGGDVQFTLAMSGHVAGVVNPPTSGKYGYWKNNDLKSSPDKWLADAKHYEGSWWDDWIKWIEGKSGAKVPARKPGGGTLKPIENAPGSYVKARAE
ncbi:class I poly(R)-hydroxyalkanoic acid synthase [Micavibrio aeruginosavorus]|uniref:class I poly(R)-hydroxyalkanoic acid synthase n=1 Tax=Micavibrio aeruginosavorus TaxID=349221 RepID=UPI003F4AB324